AARIILVAAPAEEALQAEGPLGRGAEEHLPVDGLGRGIRRDGVDPGARGGVAVVGRADKRNLTEFARGDGFLGGALLRGTHSLAAHLHDAPVLARRGDDLFTLG